MHPSILLAYLQKYLPEFYKNVFIAFTQVETIKSITILNDYEPPKQQMFVNEIFIENDKCLLFKSWMQVRLLYAKDIFQKNGNVQSDN